MKHASTEVYISQKWQNLIAKYPDTYDPIIVQYGDALLPKNDYEIAGLRLALRISHWIDRTDRYGNWTQLKMNSENVLNEYLMFTNNTYIDVPVCIVIIYTSVDPYQPYFYCVKYQKEFFKSFLYLLQGLTVIKARWQQFVGQLTTSLAIFFLGTFGKSV